MDGSTASQLALLTGRHISTVRRWLRSRSVPPWVMKLEQFGRDLGDLDRTWSGWAVRAGVLVSPEGWTFRPGEIRSIPFLHAQIRTYQALQRTHLQADWVDGRYVEPRISAIA